MSSRSAPTGPGPGAEAPGRCGHCGARLNPADQWCTLCHTPVFSAADDSQAEPEAGQDHVPEQAVHGTRRRPELTPERIEQLLERLAASETRTAAPTGIGPLDGLNTRTKALLLAGAGGLVLLAAGLLALYVLGTLV